MALLPLLPPGLPSALPGLPFALPGLAVPSLGALLHPGILVAGAAAAAVPIVIHLLNRRRVQPLRWAAMTWLLAAVKKHQRRLRMENWIVLLLRTLALLLLGLALARFSVADSPLEALARPRRSVALLLDTSASTGARDGSRSVSDRVREEAERVLAGLSDDDVVAVVLSNDVRTDRSGVRPRVLVPRAVGAEGVARARVELASSFRPTEARASWPEAIAAASPRALFQDGDANRTLVWITDLQAADWSPKDARSGGDGAATGGDGGPVAIATALEAVRRGGCDVRIVDANGTPGRSLGNLAVTGLSTLGGDDVFRGQPFSIEVRVANSGERAISRAAVRLWLDDGATPVAQTVLPDLPAARTAPFAVAERSVVLRVERDAAFRTAGAHVVRVEVTPPDGASDADALALDSRRHLALDVRQRLNVVAWIRKGEAARFDPTTQIVSGVFLGEDRRESDVFTFRSVAGEDDLRRLLDDPSAEVDLLILGNREPRSDETAARIASFVRGGGALVAFVGDRFDPVAWNRAFHDAPDQRLLPWTFGPLQLRGPEDPRDRYAIDLEAPTSHPLSQAVAGESAGWIRDVPLPQAGISRLLPDPEPATAPAPRRGSEAVVLRFRREAGVEGPAPVAAVEGAYGLGRTLWCGVALDDAWNPNAQVPFLLVFLNEAALRLTRRPVATRNLEVGGVLRSFLPRDASAVRLLVPGRGGVSEETPTVHSAVAEGDRPEVVHDRIGTTGVWRLTYARPPAPGSGGAGPRSVTEVFSVAPPAEEGILLRAPRADVLERARSADAAVLDSWAEATAERLRAGEGELSGVLLLLVLGILLLEPFLAMRFGRHGERDGRAAAAGGAR